MPRLLTKRGCWITLAAAPFLLFLAAWGADKLWPLPLHEVNPARVVVAQDGTPLWRFADADGIWRYPVTIEDVSPRYLEALINYEDHWFWKHPGGESILGGARSMARSHFGTGYFRWQHAHYAGCSSA